MMLGVIDHWCSTCPHCGQNIPVPQDGAHSGRCHHCDKDVATCKLFRGQTTLDDIRSQQLLMAQDLEAQALREPRRELVLEVAALHYRLDAVDGVPLVGVRSCADTAGTGMPCEADRVAMRATLKQRGG